jgi:hypothetical protein
VPIKRQWLVISAEDLRRGLVQGAVVDQLIERCAMLKMRIDGDERLWPKSITRIDRFDLGADIRCPNLSE